MAQNHVVVSEVPVREYGAVNYHKVALEGQSPARTVQEGRSIPLARCFTRLGGVAGRCQCCQGRSSGEVNTRGDKQCCSCLEKSNEPEQTSSGNTPSTRAARGGGSEWCWETTSPRAARGRACGGAAPERTWKGRAACRSSDAVERTQLQLKPTVWAKHGQIG